MAAKLVYGHVISDGVRIHYYRTGEVTPPLILLHGVTDNGLCWSRLALSLAPEYDLIMVDARGHGFSEAPAIGYSPDDYARDVANLIQHLDLEPPILIGHSMGAETAARTAASYPQLVKGLILEDPPWRDTQMSDEDRTLFSEKLKAQIEQYRKMSLDEIIALGKKEHPNWDEAEWLQWAKSKQQVRPQIAAGILAKREAWQDVAAKISCPVLLIRSDPELGGIVTAESARQAAKGWKKGSLIIHIPEAGHNIRREQFDAFLDSVREFLDRF
jgi:N-formylmaleamate deformylase